MTAFEGNFSSLKEYREAISDLTIARSVLSARYQAAQELGDLEAGSRSLRDLRAVFDRCKEIRRQLSPRDRLICDYSIESQGEHVVSVTLPAKMSALTFLTLGDEFVRDHYGYEAAQLDRSMSNWMDAPDFIATCEDARRIIADGCVDGTSNLIREDQEAVLVSKGIPPISMADLAVAHMALQIASGEDLFLGKVIRTKDGAMIFNNVGLHPYHVDDWRKGDHTAMAARIGEGRSASDQDSEV